MGRHLPPDHSKGDANTVGGYRAVHDRPAGFEGSDGRSYSVEVVADATDDPAQPWGAYLLFVQWSPGDPSPHGHLESGFLVRAPSDREALSRLGAMPLAEARAVLEELIAAREGTSARQRPWWEAMRDEGSQAE